MNGFELPPSDTYTVSVVASNIVGSGTAAMFPYTGYLFTVFILCPLHHIIIAYKHTIFSVVVSYLERTREHIQD